ncbi:CGG triplet repeat-binding protein 1 [Folsomia candida]|uniref:CGG triplet repeat-binding protein 1 n=1 Tax=Folsomia candida TaxID=158441 RepID=A0A226F3J6_FOLCA|nr:CGG triplet repeat-binding protein 1 [Folsomia candida]
MGKQKTDHKSLHAGWIQDLKVANIIKIDGAKLVCLACQSNFTFKQKSQLEQHIKTSIHENLAKKFAMDPQRQILLSEAVESQSNKPFYKNMCQAFISAGIPWKKLQNPVLQNFLQTYTGRAIPDESTLRKNYLPQIYAEAIEEIRRDVGTNPIWLWVDETTDACGRYIANVLIGSLKKDEPSKSHLICSKQLEKTNNATVTKLVLDSLHVDKFVANMKTAFKKAPSRIAIYKEKCPDLPLPPNPVITRWGTWLKATEFYAQHFNEMKDIIETIKNDAASVNTLKTMIQSHDLPRNLAFISLNYTFLAEKLTELQEHGGSLHQTLQYLDEIENKLLKVNGNIGKAVIEKFRTVIGKNPDLEKLKQISSILEGESDEELPAELNPAEVAAFNYAPLTSVETERSFSMHKFLLSDRRQEITPENLEMELVSRYESLTED